MSVVTGTTTAVPDPAVTRPTSLRMADMFERLVWTFVASFTSALVTPPLAQAAGLHLSLSPLDSGLVAGFAAVVNYVSLLARWRLRSLPDPGSFLRG